MLKHWLRRCDRFVYQQLGLGEPFDRNFSPRHGARADGVVVLVHGLLGNIHTWDKMAALLVGDASVGRWDIARFGHSAPIFTMDIVKSWLPGFAAIRPEMTLRSRGEELADFLVELLDRVDYPRVVLVGHSLGGLVNAQAVRTLAETGGSKRERTINRLRALVFYGTPFRGSHLVSNALAGVFSGLRILKPDSEERGSLVSWMEQLTKLGQYIRVRPGHWVVTVAIGSSLDRWVPRPSSQLGPASTTWSVSHTRLLPRAHKRERGYTVLVSTLENVMEHGSELHNASEDFLDPDVTTCLGHELSEGELEQLKEIYESDWLESEAKDSWENVKGWLAQHKTGLKRDDMTEYLWIVRFRGRVRGFVYLHYAFETKWAWLSYLMVAKPEPGEGQPAELRLGKWLARRALARLRVLQRHCRGAFFELQYPLLAEGKEQERRSARIRLFQASGARAVLEEGYYQPLLSPEEARRVRGYQRPLAGALPMHLMIVPLPTIDRPMDLTKDEVRTLLRTIVIIQGGAFLEAPDYRVYLQRWLDALCDPLPELVAVREVDASKYWPRKEDR